MATAFPAALDTFTNPTGGQVQGSTTPTHSGHHANVNDAIEAIEAKLGIGTDTAAANEVLAGTGAGATAFAQIVNAMVSSSAAIDVTKLGVQPYVFVSDNTNQSIGDASETDITWNTETSDTIGIHAASSANFVIPAGYGGLWVASGLVLWTGSAAGNIRQLRIHNSPVSVAGANANWTFPSDWYLGVTAIFHAGAGNSIRMTAYQNSGASLNIKGATLPSYFFMGRIG